MTAVATSPLAELQDSAGAEWAERAGHRVARHYRDGAEAEYGRAREGAGLFPLNRRLLSVAGPKRASFLHNMISNAIEGVEPGHGCLASLMDVRGHLQALFRASVTAKTIVLELPAARLAVVHELFLHYKVGAPVRFAEEPRIVLGLIGTASSRVLSETCAATLPDTPQDHTETTIDGRTVRLVRASDLPGSGWTLHVAPEDAAAVWATLVSAGADPVGEDAVDALRIEHGRPWFDRDVDDSHLLHETGLLNEYHSSAKGCYLGQEVVARLEGRGGHVNKKLCGVRLEARCEPDVAIRKDDREVGRLTTVARSPRHGAIAMGYVHRGAFDPGTGVRVGPVGGTVVALPLDPS